MDENFDWEFNNKVIKYRARVFNGEYKWQFGSDVRSIQVIKITSTGDHWADAIVRYQDGHKDPDRVRFFEAPLNEFATYLAKNDARVHWTVGA